MSRKFGGGHLSRLPITNPEEKEEIRETFLDEQLLAVQATTWFADYANYLVKNILSEGLPYS